ncbi:MAG: hypothetical protein PHX83_13965, partial [Acidobacteriia bacterium]|nr:hypothetical protein [Terriglobia bacterium]
MRSRLLTFLCCLALVSVVLMARPASAQPSGCVVPPSGMVGWWPGDGNANDISSQGNHATLQNGASFADGHVAQAFAFNGTNQYVSIPATANLPIRGTNSFTIDAWVNHQGDAAHEMFNIFAYRFGATDYQFFITRTQIAVWADHMVLILAHGLAPAAWNHYAFTRDGNTWRVYANGAQVGSDVNDSVNLHTPTTPQNIGTNGVGNTQFAIGLLDELEIFDRALSLTEIQSIYNAGSAGKCKPLCASPSDMIGWWPGDGNANDASGHGHNGTLQNGATYAPGRIGQAFSFAGTGDFVEVPDNPSLDISGGMSISFWAKLNSVDAWRGFISKAIWAGGYQDTAFTLKITPAGRLNFLATSTGGEDGLMWPESNSALAPGAWHHYAVVYLPSTYVRFYIDGNLDAERTAGIVPSIYNSSQPIRIGQDAGSSINGLMDETSLYNRALSTAEIQSIYNAGSAGMCRQQQCTAPPSGMVSWWPGDGNANDIKGANNGTLEGGVSFTSGKVGEAFNFNGVDSGVDLGSWFNFQTFTIDMWVKPAAAQVQYADIMDNNHSNFRSWVIQYNNIGTQYVWGAHPDGGIVFDLVADTWQHLAITRDSSNVYRLYLNGVLVGSTTGSGPLTYDGTQFLRFGRFGGGGRNWAGQLDEVEIFSRALSQTEIQAIVNAGSAGKCRAIDISKAFRAASIPLNGTTNLSFSLTNPNATSSQTGIGFTDNLPDGLVVSTPNGLTGSCGGGTFTASAGSSSLTLSGASLDGGGSCTISVNVQGATAGVKNNSVTATSTDGGTGNTSDASITVVAPPTIAKAFSPNSIPLNGTSTITFSLTNPNSTVGLSGVGFTDSLPGGMTVANPAHAVTHCGGTFTPNPGDASLTFSGGVISTAEKRASVAVTTNPCTVTVDVTSSTVGNSDNTTTAITSTEGGTGSTSNTATLAVVAPPTISKAFGASNLSLNGTTTLTFTLTNPGANTVAETGVAFTDNLPSGLVVAAEPGVENNCGGTFAPNAGDTTLSLMGGSINAELTCTPPPSGLQAWWPGDGNANDIQGGNNGTLLGGTFYSAAKVGQGFTFDSNDDGVTIPHNAALDVQSTGFTADFWMAGTHNQPEELFDVVDKSHGWVDSSGWAFEGYNSSGILVFYIGAGGGGSGNFPPILSLADILDGQLHHIAGTWDGSNMRLYVDGVLQGTTPLAQPTNNTRALKMGYSWGSGTPQRFFRGSLDEVEVFNRALSQSEIQSIYNADSAGKCKTAYKRVGSTISNNTCTVTVNVTGTTAGLKNNTTEAVSSSNGGTGTTSNTATLTVVAPPAISKSFGAATFPLNGTTSLTFNLSNPNGSIALTGVGFTDSLPAGLQVAATPGATNNCGGTYSPSAGDTTVTLSGGTLGSSKKRVLEANGGGSSCTLSVIVTGTSAGVKNNSVSANSNEGGTGNTSDASVTVVAPPSIAKAFGAPSIQYQATTSLTFTLTNPAPNTVAETGVAFTDTLPAGLVVATPNGLTNTCGGTATASAGSTSISLTGGTTGNPVGKRAMAETSGEFCTVAVNVTGTTPGIKNNTTGAVSSTNGGTGNTASASVTVFEQADLQMNKAASTTMPLVGSTLIYNLGVTNLGPTAATGARWTDVLPAGMTFGSLNSPAGWVCNVVAGVLTCTKAAGMAVNEVATFTLVATIDCGHAHGTLLSHTATVTFPGADPVAANNSSTTTLTVSNPPSS